MSVRIQSQDAKRRYYQYKELSKGCSMYEPCELTYKCKNKASHLYLRCQECPIPHATATHKQLSFMIRRENFAITVSKETAAKLVQWDEERANDERA